MAVPLAILAFGLADVSHDMLVTPTRAQMNDLFPPDLAESRSATLAGLAKVVAILCAMLLNRTKAFLVVAALAAVATLMQLAAKPSNREVNISESLTDSSDISCCSIWGLAPKLPGYWEMWSLQFAGWLSVCTWSFYFSSVWAEMQGAKPGTKDFDDAVRGATQWLLYGSFVFMASGSILPRISGPSSVCRGEWTALYMAVLMMAVTLLLCCAPQLQALCAAWVVLAMPVAYQILANAPFAWLERQPGFKDHARGLLTGTFNASLATSQALTALLSGPVAAHLGRLNGAMQAAALLDALVLTAVALSRLCR